MTTTIYNVRRCPCDKHRQAKTVSRRRNLQAAHDLAASLHWRTGVVHYVEAQGVMQTQTTRPLPLPRPLPPLPRPLPLLCCWCDAPATTKLYGDAACEGCKGYWMRADETRAPLQQSHSRYAKKTMELV